MKTVSNTISEPFTRLDIDEHIKDTIGNQDYDFLAIDENLKGESTCHLMNSDQIFKTIRNKEKMKNDKDDINESFNLID